MAGRHDTVLEGEELRLLPVVRELGVGEPQVDDDSLLLELGRGGSVVSRLLRGIRGTAPEQAGEEARVRLLFLFLLSLEVPSLRQGCTRRLSPRDGPAHVTGGREGGGCGKHEPTHDQQRAAPADEVEEYSAHQQPDR